MIVDDRDHPLAVLREPNATGRVPVEFFLEEFRRSAARGDHFASGSRDDRRKVTEREIDERAILGEIDAESRELASSANSAITRPVAVS